MTASGEYRVAVDIEARRLEDALIEWHDVLLVRFAYSNPNTDVSEIYARLHRCRRLAVKLFRESMLA